MLKRRNQQTNRRVGHLEHLENRELMAADFAGSAALALPEAGAAALPIEVQPAPVDPGFELAPVDPGILIPVPIPDPVVGTWDNVNPYTGGITKFQITHGADGYQVEAWGACFPTDCEWGKTDLDLLGTSVSDTTPDYAIGSWDPGFKVNTLTIDLHTPAGKVADLYGVFTDDSGRQNYHQRFLLTDGGDLIELQDFGNDDLADVIEGGWVNSDPDTRGITMAKVTADPSGQLSTQLWGSCSPSDCDWGAVPMHGVGSSIGDYTPEYAIADYDHGFKTAFVTTRFDNGDLVLGTYNVFHDGSDRSNYFSESRMWKVGDANHDGIFNSSDLVKIMQAGEYEDDVEDNSTWEEGDFDRDGDFTSSDIVMAFQCGNYEPPRRLFPFEPPVLIPMPTFDPTIRFDSIGGAIDDVFLPEHLDDILPPRVAPAI